MKRKTLVIWVCVLGVVLLGVYRTIHNSEIRRLTANNWIMDAPNELAGESPIEFTCDTCPKVLRFFDDRTFTLTETCSQEAWSGAYEAERSFMDVPLYLVFDQDNITAMGVCSKTYYVDNTEKDCVVLGVGEAGFFFAAEEEP